MRLPRVSRFTDRYPFVGPSVWMLAALFFVAQVGVAYRWQSAAAPSPNRVSPYHPYSFFANTISDLGETSKFTYGNPHMWSPDHFWMNLAFFLLGLVMITGAPLVYQEFTENTPVHVWIARVAFSAQALAGLGAMFVAFFPENEHPLAHVVGAALAIAVGTVGVFLLAVSLPLPGRLRGFMLWTGPVSLTAIFLFALHEYLGFGPGGMERVAAYPEVIWLITFGFYLSRSHYAHGSAHRPLSRPGEAWSRRGFVVDVPPVRPRLRLPAPWRLPIARVGEGYAVRLKGFGGTVDKYRFTERPLAEPGLELSSDGTISGIPTRKGTWRVPVELTDGTETVNKTYRLTVRSSHKSSGSDCSGGGTPIGFG
jgi:hypothetical membrane protein